MTGPTLTPRDARAVLIGCACMAAILLGRGVPLVLRWSAQQQDAAVAARARHAHAVAEIRALDSLRAQVATERAALSAVRVLLLQGSSPETAGAALGDLITQCADYAQVAIGSVQFQSVGDSTSALPRVSARVSLTGDFESVTHFLAEVESTEELLVVRELTMTQPDATMHGSRREVVSAEIAVESRYRRGTGDR
jgi:hypothetical protein